MNYVNHITNQGRTQFSSTEISFPIHEMNKISTTKKNPAEPRIGDYTEPEEAPSTAREEGTIALDYNLAKYFRRAEAEDTVGTL